MSANPGACAACGKTDNLVTCECSLCTENKGRVKPTSYCDNNGRCQNFHKPEHERMVSLVGSFANMLLDAKKREWEEACRLYDGDEELFKAPAMEECPVCCLPLPIKGSQWYYQACCGKVICNGCIVQVDSQTEECPCPYCRVPACLDQRELIPRLKQRAAGGDGEALSLLGDAHDEGWYGLEKDAEKALELWTEGAELGSSGCHYKLGLSYYNKEDDADAREKARYHLGEAAMAGVVRARFALGQLELKEAIRTGAKEARTLNGVCVRRAVKHWMISASVGCQDSLDRLKDGYRDYLKKHLSKDELAATLRAHKDATDAMKSDQRKRANLTSEVHYALRSCK
ncbi:hypothetical protein ACHAXT_003068 [Thalassiosira profunda]